MCSGHHHLQRELLQAAASNNVHALRLLLAHTRLPLSAVFRWVNPKTDETQLRPLLMVAAHQGSVEACFHLLLAGADVNQQAPLDGYSALHAAVEGASSNSPTVVELLLKAGAHSSTADVYGRRPVDLVSELMCSSALAVSIMSAATNEHTPQNVEVAPEPVEQPSDLDKDEFKTDDFRCFAFKVAECPREDAHDWTECPFAHPGEKARRRDPRVFTYNGTACPDFRKGTCKRGDACPFAHGVFECWLHPSKYRTQLCKDGTSCTRRVCFFAHTLDELRTTNDGASTTATTTSACDEAEEPDSQCSTPEPRSSRSTSPAYGARSTPLPASGCCCPSTCASTTSSSSCSSGASALSACASVSDISDFSSVRTSHDDFCDALSEVSSLATSPPSCSRQASADVYSARPGGVSYGPIGGPIHPSASSPQAGPHQAAAASHCGIMQQQQHFQSIWAAASSTCSSNGYGAMYSLFQQQQHAPKNSSYGVAPACDGSPLPSTTTNASSMSWLPFASNVMGPHLCSISHLL